MSNRAIVKYVLSGDTVAVRPKEAPEKGKVPKERILHIAGVQTPRLGSMSREDEPHAFQAREYLCQLLLGKEVAFNITHTLESNHAGPGREFVSLFIAPAAPGQPPQDVAALILAEGWARMRDGVGEGDEAIRRLGAEEAKKRDALRAIEAQAKAEGKGVWDEQPESQRTVSFQMPTDPQAFIAEHKGEEIEAIVEQVRDGTQLRCRLLLEDGNHQFVNLVLAGAKSPRASTSRDSEVSNGEPWGDEAKYFTEVRVLQRHIKVRLLSAPASLGANPLQSQAPNKPTGFGLPGPNGLPAPSQGSTVIIGTAMHPKGNIAEFLLGAGLAKVVDWHVGLLAPYGGLDKFRAVEKASREKKLGIWENFAPVRATANGAPGAVAAQGPPSTKGTDFEATVTRIWGSDQLSIVERTEGGKERRVQLSSVRGPRGVDAKQTYWANEAKEFLRKRLIGKHVHVHVDYVKPKEGEFEERECVTIRYGNQNHNISEQLIEKGLATVLRHKRDDEDRSVELDKLILAEQTAQTGEKGLHSTKEVVMPRIVDASEKGSMASSYLPQWKRAGKHAAVVDFVSAGSRFKLFMPKEHTKITLVLAGIRAPRTARNASEKSEPFGAEALKFASKYLQRDVEVAFDSTDRSGGFIGIMYAGGANVAVELVQEGLASVHERAAETLPFGRELVAAEEKAKKEKKGIWSTYSEEEASAKVVSDPTSALPTEYKDVYITAVKDTEPFTFSVQVLEPASVASLTKLMSDFGLHHKQSSSASPAGFSPKAGELISAKFSEDNQWYRARVKRASAIKKEAQVILIDYGNEETLPFSRLRPLDSKFKNLPGQAQEARLSFVKLAAKSSEYGPEARRRFEDLTGGLKLIANIDQREGNLLHLRLIDPTDPQIKEDPLACVNADLIRDGLATIDKSCPYLASYPQVVKKLQQSTEDAKADRYGIFEFGDVSED